MASDLREELALLTDNEAGASLQGVLKGQAIREPIYQEIFSDPEKMKQIVKMVADDAKIPLPALDNLSHEETSKGIRVSLLQIAEDEKLRPKLELWLRDNLGRDTLAVDPVTVAEVLAGIVFVLSSRGSFSFNKKAGEPAEVKVTGSRSPTTESFLENFFRLFPTFRAREDNSKAGEKPPST